MRLSVLSDNFPATGFQREQMCCIRQIDNSVSFLVLLSEDSKSAHRCDPTAALARMKDIQSGGRRLNKLLRLKRIGFDLDFRFN
jgi:hypothetical protein